MFRTVSITRCCSPPYYYYRSSLTSRKLSSLLPTAYFRRQEQQHQQQQRDYISTSSACYAAVKELPWCSPSDSPNRNRHEKEKKKKKGVADAKANVADDKATAVQQEQQENIVKPIDRFGIVAAVSKDGIIGIDGRLPWKLQSDRKNFKILTSNKILIIGRNTLQELSHLKNQNKEEAHIQHAANTIIISNTLSTDITMNNEDNNIQGNDNGVTTNDNGTIKHVVRSFPEALALARELADDDNDDDCDNNETTTTTTTDLDCWIAGGENIYHEALLHSSAERLHLTLVDIDVLNSDCSSSSSSNDQNNNDDETAAAAATVARFPAKYRWDNRFQLISSANHTDETTGISYCEQVYHRIRGKGSS